MHYTIDSETFAINIFNDGNDVPFQFQPHYPNMDTFDSVEEATVWAEASIAAHDPLVQTFAPDGKGLTGSLKPQYQPEFLAKEAAKVSVAAKLAALGLTAEEIAALSK